MSLQNLLVVENPVCMCLRLCAPESLTGCAAASVGAAVGAGGGIGIKRLAIRDGGWHGAVSASVVVRGLT